jgi:penicillin-binding protein 1A
MRGWPWGRIALGTLVFLIVVAVVPPFRRAATLAVSKVVLLLATPIAPDIHGFNALPGTTTIVAKDGSTIARLDDGEKRIPVKLKDLPPEVPHAVLAAEDANFYHHSGIDPAAVLRAVVRNAEGGHTQGGSTITQQLAKINYTNSQRTVFRKLREILYATRLEQKYTKDQLLERYLNQVYFGDHTYGIAAASQDFFGVAPKDLTPAQAAMLAGKIHSPEGLDPRAHPDAVQHRRDEVLRAMRKHGWLTSQQLSEATAADLGVIAPVAVQQDRKAPYFVDYVRREALDLEQLGGTTEGRRNRLDNGGLTIKTTLDPKELDAATAAATAHLNGPEDPTTAIASVQPGDGAIRLLFGGLHYDKVQFDVSSQGHKQPGSSFKPFVYLAALRAGIDPRSTLDAGSPKDLPYPGGTFHVSNFSDGEASGPMNVDEALVKSINTVFAQLVLSPGVGPGNVVKAAENAGVRQENGLGADSGHPAVALGGLTRGVAPLDMATAYATFAAKGKWAKPYAIASITDKDGKAVYNHKVETKDVFDPKEVGVLNATLMQVVQRGTGTAARLNRPVAGKTGTAENFQNAWFVGYVPQLSTAVWVGHPDKDVPMTNVHGVSVAGGTFPARIWHDTMQTTLAGLPVLPIFTASPDSLGLHTLESTTTSSSSSSSSSSSTSSTIPQGSTTIPPNGSTSTTQKPKQTTTTTKKPNTSSTTSTTSPP